MFSNIGVPGLILILIIALVIFGPSKLPDIGKAVGSSLKEFKKATSDAVSQATIEEDPQVKDKNQTSAKHSD